MKKHLMGIGMAMMMMAAALTGCSGAGQGVGNAEKTTAAKTEAAVTETASDKSGSADVTWPTKTLQMICPFAAGGDTDANARWAAQYLTDELGIDVVVVNTTGNGGAVGARAAREAENDGSMALFSSSAIITNELSGAIDFGLDEFEFSCIIGENPGLIACVNKSLGVNNFQELIDYSKAHPGELKMAYNTGATTHAVALQIIDAGVDATLVDAAEASDRIAALLGGHIDIIINTYGSVKDYLKSGDFVGMGLIGTKSSEFIPEYPSLKDQGFDVEFPSCYFIAFPKGTDPELAKTVSEAWKHVVETNEEYANSIKEAYMQTPTYYGPEEGRERMDAAKENIAKYTAQFQQK